MKSSADGDRIPQNHKIVPTPPPPPPRISLRRFIRYAKVKLTRNSIKSNNTLNLFDSFIKIDKLDCIIRSDSLTMPILESRRSNNIWILSVPLKQSQWKRPANLQFNQLGRIGWEQNPGRIKWASRKAHKKNNKFRINWFGMNRNECQPNSTEEIGSQSVSVTEINWLYDPHCFAFLFSSNKRKVCHSSN